MTGFILRFLNDFYARDNLNEFLVEVHTRYTLSDADLNGLIPNSSRYIPYVADTSHKVCISRSSNKFTSKPCFYTAKVLRKGCELYKLFSAIAVKTMAPSAG